ncbi:MAG: FG-GAP-like repeat-containing protein [Pseudomonadota bacterium]
MSLRYRLVLCALPLLMVVVPAAHAVTAALGTIPGSVSVSETGAATYAAAIPVPPGTGGMEPKLSLNYTSQGGNGLLGVGWSLGGLSAIYRCPKSIAQDGAFAGVEYNTNDRFCLDGNRLLVTYGNYGANQAEYRTEMDGYSKVVSYGTPGEGPTKFKVWTKAGLIMEYGYTEDSRIEANGKTAVRVWSVNKISDTKGNYLTVTYTEDTTNGDYRPTRIDYTGNDTTATPTFNSVQFEYEARPDEDSHFPGGTLVKMTKRLKTLKTYAAAALVSEFKLTYEADATPNEVSRLVTLKHCAGDGVCMPATTFGWRTPTEPVVEVPTAWTGASGVGTSATLPGAMADINGDGKEDYFLDANALGQVKVAYSTGTGFQAMVVAGTVTNWSALGGNPPILAGDLNGDGRADLFNVNGWNGTSKKALLSTATGFTATTWASVPSAITAGSQQWMADFNGDGKADIAYVEGLYLKVAYSTGSGFQAPVTASNILLDADSNIPRILIGDLNGDGRADALSWGGWGFSGMNALLSKTSGFEAAGWDSMDLPYAFGYGQLADLNGDGMDDYVWDAGAFGKVTVAYSIGNGFAYPVDLDEKYVSTVLERDNFLLTGDLDGNGRADLFHKSGWGSSGNKALLLKTNEPNHIETITNGLGATTTFSYLPLTDGSVYLPDANAVYPVRDVLQQGPMYVVSQLFTDNGLGGNAINTYTYAGAKAHLQGRGLLGFRSVSVLNEQTGVTHSTEYRQDFPYVLMPERITRTASNGVLLYQIENEFAHLNPNGNRYFPYIHIGVESSYELNGTLITQVTTTTDYDTFGNPTQIEVETDDGHSKLTVNTYTNNTNSWLLGRLNRATVTSTLPDGSSLTRSSLFEYDGTTGLMTKEVIEPDQTQFRLDTVYGYDDYGNKKTVTVSSPATGQAAITSRTTTTTFDTTHNQFPTSVKNALNQSETRTYNTDRGTLASVKGPNNLTTNWLYDGFGRKTQEARADGTTTDISYKACSTECPANAAYYVKSTQTGTPEARVYLDRLEREIRSAVKGYDTRWVNKDTEYDTAGRILRVSRPYYEGEAIYWTTRHYDDLGRVVEVEELDDDNQTIRVQTDYQGLTTHITDPKGRVTSTVKNSQGWILSVTDPDLNTTTYSHDALGNLLRTQDSAGNAIVNTYDIRGRKLTMDDPDMGHWIYDYNALGELVRQVDGRDKVTTMAYDLLGRMTNRTEADLITNWNYDKYKDGSTCSKGTGKLCEVTASNNISSKYSYDSYGRATSVTRHVDVDYTTSQTYDSYGRPSVTTYPGGFAVTSTYSNGYLYRLKNTATGLIYWTANTRDAGGHVLSETLGNGLTTTRGYSPQQGRLTSILTNGPNGTVQDRLFDYDNVGNLESRSDAVRAITESFGYDNLDRLTSASGGGTNITAQYDPLGNLTYRSDVGTYQYAGTRPHAVSSISGTVNTSFSYDGNGNMLSGRGSTITWFNYNLPATITKAGQTNFLYDYDHARAQQTAPDGTVTRYVNDLGIHYEKEIKGSLTEYKHSLMAGGKLIGEYVSRSDGTNSTRYFHTDHLGSIEVVTDEAGAVIARYAFDPWGKRTTVSGDGTLADQGFTGHEMLDNGFIHMGGRIYDPVIGRMLSADPYIQAPYLGQNLNRYSYVLNNPLRFTDPDGHFIFALFSVIANAIAVEVAGVVIAEFGIQSLIGQALIAGITSGIANGIMSSAAGGGFDDGFRMGAINGALFHAAGSYAQGQLRATKDLAWADGGIAKSLVHAGAGCLSGVASGSGCGSGALSAGFAEYAGGKVGFGGAAGEFAGRVIVGGTASMLGGGKFANGATTAAFGYLYNDWSHLERGRQIHELFGQALGEIYGDENVRLETSFSWREFRFRTDVILFNRDVFELKSHTYQLAESPSRYYATLDKVLNTYVPGLNEQYNTTRFQAGDFRNYATNGSLTVLTVGNITGRPILSVNFFADPTTRNSGIVFYRPTDLGQAQ